MTTDFPFVAHTAPLPIDYFVPPQNPTPYGLYAATSWSTDGNEQGISRHLFGVSVRGNNYLGSGSFGVWGGGICGQVVTITVDPDADGGTFDVTVDGQTATVAYDVSAAAFKTALDGLNNLVPGDVAVTEDSGVYTLHFTHRHVVSVDDTDVTNGTVTAGYETKTGTRPDILDPFEPITVWAYDECGPTPLSRDEVNARAAQVLRLQEQQAVEREFAARLLLDANDLPGSIETASDIVEAVAYLESETALSGTSAFFHAGAQWASAGVAANGLVRQSGTRWVSPLGNVWIFGGGYGDALGDTIVATSQPFGWRDEITVRPVLDQRHNIYAAVAERSVTIGYEAVVTAVTIT